MLGCRICHVKGRRPGSGMAQHGAPRRMHSLFCARQPPMKSMLWASLLRAGTALSDAKELAKPIPYNALHISSAQSCSAKACDTGLDGRAQVQGSRRITSEKYCIT